MTLHGGPSRARSGARIATLVVGVAAALLGDAVAYAGVPALREAWSPAGVSASASPLPTIALPTPQASGTTRTTATPSGTASSTAGSVPVTDDIKRGVVLIDAALDSATASAGTGMVLTSDGLVLTNYHVVRSSVSITVTKCDDHRRYSATLVGRDALHDVALLRITGASGLSTITPDNDPVALHDAVVAAGNAAGQGYLTAYAGKIVGQNQSVRVRGASPNDPEENLSGLLETDAHAEPGDSGGPLFDAENEVLGMTTAGSGSNSGRGTAFAVPLGQALAIVDKIKAGDEAAGVVVGAKPALGVNATNDGSKGVLVTKVVSGSPASKTALKSGDHIVSLGGHKVSNLSDLMNNLDLFQPGDSVTLQWTTSSGATKSATVVLDASKYN